MNEELKQQMIQWRNSKIPTEKTEEKIWNLKMLQKLLKILKLEKLL
jgi:hypothetical protein